MGLIQNLIQKAREKKEMRQNMENQVSISEKIEQKRLSANERELNKYIEEDRQKKIKEVLNNYRKDRDNDIKFGHNPIYIKNIVKDDKNLFKHKKIFSNQKNIFSGRKNNGLFFRGGENNG